MKAAIAAIFLAGCATLDRDPSYNWQPDQTPAVTYDWYQGDRETITRICGGPQFIGCVDRAGQHCVVNSIYSESDAKRVYIGFFSHFDHEVAPGSANGRVNRDAWMGHCAGFSHEVKK